MPTNVRNRWLDVVLSALLVGLGAGCSGTGPAGNRGDGFSPDAGEGTGAEVALPVLTPCPDGWREVSTGEPLDVAVCEPWPTQGASGCDVGSTIFPGEAGCQVLGTVCPTGDWAPDVPDGTPVRYVHAGAPAGGDGTRDHPFATIGEALRAADPGTVVAIDRGVYDENLTIPGGVTLWGACEAKTVIGSQSSSAVAARIAVGGTDVTLRNLEVLGGNRGIYVYPGTALELDDVLVEAALRSGITVQGSDLHGQGVVIRDTRKASSFFVGIGLELYEGAHADLQRVRIEGTEGIAISSFDADTQLLLRQAAIRDTLSLGQYRTVPMGVGVYVRGGLVQIDASVVECNAFGLIGDGQGVDLRLADVVFRGGTGSDCAAGSGMIAWSGSQADLHRVRFVDNELFAMDALESQVVARDVVFHDATPPLQPVDVNEGIGFGLHICPRATATLDRVAIATSLGFGMSVEGPDATVDGRDVTIMSTAARQCSTTACDGGEYGNGLVSTTGGQVSLERFRIDASAICGIQIADGSIVDLHAGEVANNAVGVNVQEDNYDLSRLQDRVVFIGNDRNYDGSDLPVPILDALVPLLEQ